MPMITFGLSSGAVLPQGNLSRTYLSSFQCLRTALLNMDPGRICFRVRYLPALPTRYSNRGDPLSTMRRIVSATSRSTSRTIPETELIICSKEIFQSTHRQEGRLWIAADGFRYTVLSAMPSFRGKILSFLTYRPHSRGAHLETNQRGESVVFIQSCVHRLFGKRQNGDNSSNRIDGPWIFARLGVLGESVRRRLLEKKTFLRPSWLEGTPRDHRVHWDSKEPDLRGH